MYIPVIYSQIVGSVKVMFAFEAHDVKGPGGVGVGGAASMPTAPMHARLHGTKRTKHDGRWIGGSAAQSCWKRGGRC